MLWQEWSFHPGLGYSGPENGFPVMPGSGSSERQGQGDGKAGVEGKGISKLTGKQDHWSEDQDRDLRPYCKGRETASWRHNVWQGHMSCCAGCRLLNSRGSIHTADRPIHPTSCAMQCPPTLG